MERSQSSKRKFPFSGLQRRVRARKDEPEPNLEEDYDSQQSPQASQDDDDDDEDASEIGEDEDESQLGSEDEQSEEEEEEATDPSQAAAQISFGALAKAQASLPSGRRKKGAASEDGSENEDDDDDDDDSGPEEVDRHGYSRPKKVQGRAHKHAPAEMTSKKPVTRRRQVVEVHRAQSRDPRFGPPLRGLDAEQNEDAVRKNYSFLDSYRDAEMKALRARARKTKDPFERQRMERELVSMQSRKQAQERKDAERRVVEEHRGREKELVRQGKNPFYLKKSEQKKRVLVERFQGMKKRQVDKAIVRRRKKDTAKERKELPMERRAR